MEIMDRRSFFLFAVVAPAAVAAPALAGELTSYRRLSSEKGDSGERAWAMLRADGHDVIAYLDGVEQTMACTADVDLGLIRRAVMSPGGNLCVGADDEVMIESVYGRVELRLR